MAGQKMGERSDMPTAIADRPSRTLGKVDRSFYLIGIGASAGGLDAIKQLVGQIPADFQHSFVIIQHISPDYRSMMSEILGRETSLKVLEAGDDMAVEMALIWHGVARILEKIESTGEKILTERPSLSTADKALVVSKAIAWRGGSLASRAEVRFAALLRR